MGKQIIVVGSSNVDFIMQMDRLPVVGETVTGGKFMQTYGGKGANQAVAAARAGGEVTFITGLGGDPNAEIMRDNFRRDGIDADSILIQPDVPSGSALIMIGGDGSNFIAVAPGANDALSVPHIDQCADRIREAAVVVMQYEIPVATIQRVLEIAAAADVPVLFNYAPVRDSAVSIDAHIHGLIVNEIEAAALTGLPVNSRDDARTAAQNLRACGPAFVILTLGAEGAYLSAEDCELHIPAFKVEAVDTTAAGDVFCGALAVALTEEMPLPAAVRFAGAASALSVTRMGAQVSVPTRAEIDQFLIHINSPSPQ